MRGDYGVEISPGLRLFPGVSMASVPVAAGRCFAHPDALKDHDS
jgi:hypothetical protein